MKRAMSVKPLTQEDDYWELHPLVYNKKSKLTKYENCTPLN